MTVANLPRLYFSKDGNVVGPHSLEHINDLVQRGILSEQTLVCVEGGQVWESLAQFRRRGVKEFAVQAGLGCGGLVTVAIVGFVAIVVAVVCTVVLAMMK